MKARAIDVTMHGAVVVGGAWFDETVLQQAIQMQVRGLIAGVPDGTYEGTAILEDAGHGYGDFEIKATVTIAGDSCHIAISSPPQIPYFINSYEGNSHSGVYLGLMMFAQLPPPYNEGLYRCVSTDMGPKGTLCNAKSPAPHMNCTTTPMETLTDAVRLAFEKAMPSKVAALMMRLRSRSIAAATSAGLLPLQDRVAAWYLAGSANQQIDIDNVNRVLLQPHWQKETDLVDY